MDEMWFWRRNLLKLVTSAIVLWTNSRYESTNELISFFADELISFISFISYNKILPSFPDKDFKLLFRYIWYTRFYTSGDRLIIWDSSANKLLLASTAAISLLSISTTAEIISLWVPNLLFRRWVRAIRSKEGQAGWASNPQCLQKGSLHLKAILQLGLEQTLVILFPDMQLIWGSVSLSLSIMASILASSKAYISIFLK